MNLSSEWWLSVLAAFALCMIAVIARIIQRSWLSPGASWAGFWSVAVTAPLLLAPDFPVAPAAIWFIVGFTGLFVISSSAPWLFFTPRNEIYRYRRIHKSLSIYISIFGFICGNVSLWLLTYRYGGSWRTPLSMAELASIAQSITVDRYTGMGGGTIANQILNSMMYSGALVGGHGLAWANKNLERLAYILPIFTALLHSILTTAKAFFMYALILCLSAYIVQVLRRRGHSIKMSLRAIRRFSGLAVFLAIFFVFGAALRYSAPGVDGIQRGIESLKIYSLAHISAFSGWWQTGRNESDALQWGRVSFFGPAAYLTSVEREPGVYSDNRIDYGDGSNVFTFYRGLIEDFSIVGSLISAIGAGFALGIMYCNVVGRGRRYIVISSSVLVVYYCVLFWSHVINITGYTTIALAIILYIIVYILQVSETVRCAHTDRDARL